MHIDLQVFIAVIVTFALMSEIAGEVALTNTSKIPKCMNQSIVNKSPRTMSNVQNV